MNAPISASATASASPIDEPRFFNFDGVLDQPLDADGQASWGKLFQLQAQIEITALRRELRDLHATVEQCAMCGAAPCRNISFCAACKVADRRPRRRRQ